MSYLGMKYGGTCYVIATLHINVVSLLDLLLMSAREWCPPVASCTTCCVASARKMRGVRTGALSPSPSCPRSSEPHPKACPHSFTASECCIPHDTLTMRYASREVTNSATNQGYVHIVLLQYSKTLL